jgi:hypothetical protein
MPKQTAFTSMVSRPLFRTKTYIGAMHYIELIYECQPFRPKSGGWKQTVTVGQREPPAQQGLRGRTAADQGASAGVI